MIDDFEHFFSIFVYFTTFLSVLTDKETESPEMLKKVVRKRSEFCIKALNFTIIAAWSRWSGTQNSEVGGGRLRDVGGRQGGRLAAEEGGKWTENEEMDRE